MPFVAECSFCHLMLQNVPEERLGWCYECPRCRNSFTLAPRNDLPATTRDAPQKAAAAGAVAERPVGASAPPLPASRHVETPTPADLDPFDGLRTANYPGAAAFVLASFAFLAAAVFASGAIPLVLGLAGLALGLVGFLVPQAKGRGLILPGAGTVVGMAAVIVTVFLPHWLGLTPLWGPPRPPRRAEDAVMSLTGRGLREVPKGETVWVDASRDALHHGDVRLRITSATVGPAPLEGVKGMPPPRDRCLVIGLRITNSGIVRKVGYTAWAGPAQAQDRPVLRDNQGKTYAEKGFPPGWVVKGRTASATIPPGKTVDDVLIFEPPAGEIEYLRLDLPASAVGADGRLRMEIPKGMIAPR